VPVQDFDAVSAEAGETVQNNIDKKEQINQVYELKPCQGRTLVKCELVRNKNTTDEYQQQDQAVPRQPETGMFADYAVGRAIYNRAPPSLYS